MLEETKSKEGIKREVGVIDEDMNKKETKEVKVGEDQHPYLENTEIPYYFERFLTNEMNNIKKFNPKVISFRIVCIYVLCGFIWIAFSDRLVSAMIQDKGLLQTINTFKGFVYVAISGGIIYSLLYPSLRRIKEQSKKIEEGYRELSYTYESLEAAYEELTASEEELRQQFETLTDTQQLIADSEERYRLISEAANDAIWDEWDNVYYFSERWFEMTGYSREEAEEIGDFTALIHPDDKEETEANLRRYLEGKTNYYYNEYRLKKKDGNYIWIRTRGKALFDEAGNPYRMAGSHRDITDLKEYQEKLYCTAYYDPLTKLPNRPALYAHLEKKFSKMAGIEGMMILIDVDDFKYINESLGHTSGDELLKLIVERLKEFLIDDKVSLYRLGGDDFILFKEKATDSEEIEPFIQEIYKKFKEPFRVRENSLHIQVSMGIAMYPEHGHDVNELMRCVDIAINSAKTSGKNIHAVYIKSMNDTLTERMLIEEQLRTALINEEFDVFYQPQLDIKENKITGLEALIRWNNHKLGYVSPLKFIPIAESTHFIIELGEWVLNRACAFVKKLQLQGHTDIVMSVNLSMLQLLQDNFVEMVLRILRLHNLTPECLELEITETILMESYEAIENGLESLRTHGIKIALDDFGKGYSSLSYLKQLPISTLKIDKSFIDDITNEDDIKSLTGYIVTMGKNLGLNVVAEGVETEVQLNYLKGYRCHKIQGYLFSKPVSEKEAQGLVMSGKCL